MAVTYTLPNIALYQKMGLLANWINSSEAYAGLFKSPSSFDDTVHISALTQPTAPGYALQHFTSSVVGGTSNTIATLTGSQVTFAVTANYAGETIQGVYFAMANPLAGTEILAIALLPNGPQVVSQAGDSILAQLTLTDQRAPGQP